ncbi:hypothetical protein AWB85_24195 [Mycobacteroides immunogenum]|uniref:Uncharacterized protein n=1 Tax=Mycobacteroides immunogenum TaxID=83262 RepID=A0A179VCE5_9MYCO|nr:hypothetical protein AWB85_24195 [Mycobacteroides immunogenum]
MTLTLSAWIQRRWMPSCILEEVMNMRNERARPKRLKNLNSWANWLSAVIQLIRLLLEVWPLMS